MEWLAEHYQLIRGLHIISVISWMAGLLYLPRLYVYHTKLEPMSESSELFKTMEKRLLRYIMNPAMICTFFFGVLLMMILSDGGKNSLGGWFHAKMFLVFAMAGAHGMLAKYRKDFALNKNTKSQKFFRILNEVPTVLMIGIVLLATLKPF
jgi:putative membrane protein